MTVCFARVRGMAQALQYDTHTFYIHICMLMQPMQLDDEEEVEVKKTQDLLH